MQRALCIACKHFVSLSLLLAASPANAGPAGCEGGAYQAFDFWLGRWEVRTADGTLAGHNEIIREHAGCLLVEHWQSATGGAGSSLNFYNPVDDRWRQVWVSPGSNIDIGGGLRDGSMVLEGFITYLEAAERYPFRGTWTPLDDGRVRQFFEESRESGVWKPWFDGFYSRSESRPESRAGAAGAAPD